VFIESTEGRRRVSLDSVTEMISYAGAGRAGEAVDAILDLLEEHDAVGLFHPAKGVHDEAELEDFRARFDGFVDLSADGSVAADF
jgi:hypothetical protein